MKFNAGKWSSSVEDTENFAGGKAYSESAELEFASISLTSFLKDQFYRSESEVMDRILQLMEKLDKKFVAKTAIYARTKFNMRSVSHLIAAEIAHSVKGESWTKNFFKNVVIRPDDALEILAYYFHKYKKPIPNSLKKGLRLALSKFNDYQIAKYKASKSSVKMVDVLNLLHVKPIKDNKTAFKKLVKNELASKDTWEAMLTQAGQKAEGEEELAELKKDAWDKLLKEDKLGYFALLRNLRNIKNQAPELISIALKNLTNSEKIRNSRVLPFRFSTAYRELKKVDSSRDILKSINEAAEISLKNVPKFKGKTLVVLDGSGSMDGKPIEIGALFAAMLYKTNNADYMTFSDDAEYRSLNDSDSVLTIAEEIERSIQSSGTNFHAIFESVNKAYDRIIILSDMQGWVGGDSARKELKEYKLKYKCEPKIFSFDLDSYGTLQFPEKNVFCLAGLSEKVFDVMSLLEKDKDALVEDIRKIELKE